MFVSFTHEFILMELPLLWHDKSVKSLSSIPGHDTPLPLWWCCCCVCAGSSICSIADCDALLHLCSHWNAGRWHEMDRCWLNRWSFWGEKKGGGRELDVCQNKGVNTHSDTTTNSQPLSQSLSVSTGYVKADRFTESSPGNLTGSVYFSKH